MSIPIMSNQMLAAANGLAATTIPNHSYPSDLNMFNINPYNYQHTNLTKPQQHYQRGMRTPLSSSSHRASLTANLYRSSNIYNSNYAGLNNGFTNANIKKQPSAQVHVFFLLFDEFKTRLNSIGIEGKFFFMPNLLRIFQSLIMKFKIYEKLFLFLRKKMQRFKIKHRNSFRDMLY